MQYITIFSPSLMFWAWTDQERATAASLRVAWILGKKKKPDSTDSETVKECMLASIEEVVTDDKNRKNFMGLIKQIPISDTSNMRRVECLASNVFETLLSKLRKAGVMSLAVDESTDNSDVAQLCLYVRFFDGESFREDLLGLIPMEGRTTAPKLRHSLRKTIWLAARIAAVAPQLRSLHCLIHQSLLCAKLSGVLKQTMDSVMAIINFIRCTSSLQHRLFRKLLQDIR